MARRDLLLGAAVCILNFLLVSTLAVESCQKEVQRTSCVVWECGIMQKLRALAKIGKMYDIKEDNRSNDRGQNYCCCVQTQSQLD